MTVLDAAERVLLDTDQPLHSKEITQRILGQGLWATRSERPEATLVSSLSKDIGRDPDRSRFRSLGRGLYGLQNAQRKPPASSRSEPTHEPRLTVLQAAEKVLRAKGGPLHYRDITRQILDQRLWDTSSKNPEIGVFGTLSSDIKKLSEQSRFRPLGDGVFALQDPSSPLATEADSGEVSDGPRVTVLDAAAAVIRAAGKALSYDEITQRMLSQGSWHTKSSNPKSVVGSTIATDIQKDPEASRFRSAGRGIVALKDVDRSVPQEPGSEESADGEQPMTLLQAAEQVLRSAGEPLHYRELTKRMLAQDLFTTRSLTPAASVSSTISQEIRQRESSGQAQRFLRPAPGLIGLADSQPVALQNAIEAENQRVREGLLQLVLAADPYQFEQLVADLFSAMGMEDVEVTQRSGDQGIDVRGTLVAGRSIRVKIAAQVKRWNSSISAPMVQQLRGSLGAHEQGLMVTTGGFTAQAKDAASRSDASPVGLIDRDELISLLVEHEIGVERQEHHLLRLAGSLPRDSQRG